MVVETKTRSLTRDPRRDGDPNRGIDAPNRTKTVRNDTKTVQNGTQMSERVGYCSNSYTLRELVDRFMSECRRRVSGRTKRRLSPRTVEYYQNCLDGLTLFADQSGWPEVGGITRRHLRDFQEYLETETYRWNADHRHMTSKPAAPGTVNHYLKVAAMFFRWCQDEEYVLDSPMMRFRIPSPNYNEVNPYTDSEVAAMLTTCQRDADRGNRFLGVRNKAIVSVFIDTGLRLNELAEMKLSDLDPNLQQVRVLGKGAKFRVVPINGEARKALRLYLNQYRQPGGDEVWQTEDGEALVSYSIKIMVTRLKKRSGVKSAGCVHRFRHYFATCYLENGGDLNSLRLLLGHSTLDMVLKYTRFVNTRQAIESHAEFSPLDRLYHGERHYQEERWGYKQ